MDLGQTTIICSWTFTALAVPACGCHIVFRILKKHGHGWDDYALFFAFVIEIVLVGQNTWLILHDGQNNHENGVKPSKLALVAKVCKLTLRLFGFLH